MAGDEEVEELVPPSPERVARRTVVLTCVVARANIEREAGEDWAADAAAHARAVVDEHGLWDEVEPHERALLEAPVGEVEERAIIDGTWRSEGLAVLAWALRRFELPSFDEAVDVVALNEALGMGQGEGAAELLAERDVRDAAEIDELSERLFSLHWRLREWGLSEQSLDFAEVADRSSFGLSVAGLPLANGDLAVGGDPIADAPADRVREAESIVMERRLAAGWLLGEEERYSEVPLDT